MIDALEHRPARLWGFIGLAFFVGLAAGNGWATHRALDGEAQWFRGWCGQQVQSHVQLQKNLDNQ
jgi:hypothetical protein